MAYPRLWLRQKNKHGPETRATPRPVTGAWVQNRTLPDRRRTQPPQNTRASSTKRGEHAERGGEVTRRQVGERGIVGVQGDVLPAFAREKSALKPPQVPLRIHAGGELGDTRDDKEDGRWEGES